MRPKVIECGACGHCDYHCPASGCNHAECECETFQQVTELELDVLERVDRGDSPWLRGGSVRIVSQALGRLVRKGCLEKTPHRYAVTESGRAVLLGTPPDDLYDILGLVTEHPPTVESLATLTRDEREELRDWAAREHLRASDNPVRRKPRPAWLDGLPKEATDG